MPTNFIRDLVVFALLVIPCALPYAVFAVAIGVFKEDQLWFVWLLVALLLLPFVPAMARQKICAD